jgi:hypothetical protein
MGKNTILKTVVLGILATSLLFSCNKKDSATPTNTYKTSTGKILSATDSVDGQLGETNAEVIYSIVGSGHGISLKCYDQSFKSTDTSYAEIVVYFALTKADLLAGNYLQTFYPSKDSIVSKNFGIQDSVFVKVTRDSRTASNEWLGKYALKVVQNTMPIEKAASILINDADFTLVSQKVKGQSGTYYEAWYKTTVTPGATYYVKYLRKNDIADTTITLNTFNCDFWDKDGISKHSGVDKTSQDSISSHYVTYTVPAGQSMLYIRCYNNLSGTNKIKLVDVQP